MEHARNEVPRPRNPVERNTAAADAGTRRERPSCTRLPRSAPTDLCFAVSKTADLVRLEPGALAEAGARHAQRVLALSELERAAVTELATGEVDSVRQYVVNRATAYATGDPDVRRRALSRGAAVHETQMQEFAALLAAAIARRDFEAVQVLDRMLTSATGRFRALLDQLRIENGTRRRVVVAAKGTVAVTTEDVP